MLGISNAKMTIKPNLGLINAAPIIVKSVKSVNHQSSEREASPEKLAYLKKQVLTDSNSVMRDPLTLSSANVNLFFANFPTLRWKVYRARPTGIAPRGAASSITVSGWSRRIRTRRLSQPSRFTAHIKPLDACGAAQGVAGVQAAFQAQALEHVGPNGQSKPQSGLHVSCWFEMEPIR